MSVQYTFVDIARPLQARGVCVYVESGMSRMQKHRYDIHLKSGRYIHTRTYETMTHFLAIVVPAPFTITSNAIAKIVSALFRNKIRLFVSTAWL